MSDDSQGATKPKFPGWTRPKSNYTQVPNAFWDQLPEFQTLAELKVVLYILRHTWGYQGVTQRRISLDEFQNGRKGKDGLRIDKGVGMTRANIMKGLKLAQLHGFIDVETDERDKARRSKTYKLRMKNASKQETGIETIPDENNTTGIKTIPQRYQNDTAEVLNQDLDHRKKAMKDSLEKKDSDATAPTASLNGKGKRTPKSKPEPSPERQAEIERNKAISAMMVAYHEGNGGIGKPNFKHVQNRENAGNLVDAGITDAQVKAFVEFTRREPYWRDKTVSWNYIQLHIGEHLKRVQNGSAYRPMMPAEIKIS